MSATRLEWAAPSDIPAIQTLIDRHWHAGHILSRDRALLEWQYGGPDGGPPKVLLARDGGRLAGMLGMIPFDFCLRRQRLRGGWLTMWLSLPEYRPQRLGLALMRRCIESFDMTGTLGGNDTTMRILGALGFTVSTGLHRWVRAGDPAAFDSLLGALPGSYPPGLRSSWIETARAAVGQQASGFRVIGWDQARGRWDPAWIFRFAPRLSTVWRDESYLLWRYVNHPGFRYEVYFAEDPGSGELFGLTVTRRQKVKNRPETVLRVVEFLAEPEAAPALAAFVADQTQRSGTAFADFHCSSAESGPALESVGFRLESGGATPLPSLFQPLDDSRRSLNFAGRVAPDIAGAGAAFDNSYFTRADCDQDRPN